MVVGEFVQDAELVIIGGGPGGYSAAFRAAELGIKPLLIDSRHALGGVCLHDGCVPSKTLLHTAEIIAQAKSARDRGVSYPRPRINLTAIRGFNSKVIGRLAKGLENRCRTLGVEVIHGRARFEDSRHLELRDAPIRRLHFRRAVIATGAVPTRHPMLPADHPGVLTPEVALHVNEIPKSLVVLGGGYMAVELATIYAALGSGVTLICEQERMLPEVDADLVAPLIRRLNRDLKTVTVNARLTAVSAKDDGLDVTMASEKDSSTIHADRIVDAVSQCPATGDLNLDATGVKCADDGWIEVDDTQQTSDPRIFAVGDVTGPPLLADRALAQGRVAAEVIAGQSSAFDPCAIPCAIFTDPQIAWCGVTEQEANRSGINCLVSQMPGGASGRAVAVGGADGLAKVVFDPESKLVLGVGLVGPFACELIGEAALAIEMGATLTDLAGTMHAHPTVSELLADATRQALSQ